MKTNSNRREFLRTSLMAGAGLSMINSLPVYDSGRPAPGKKVGLIGLDTSHVTAFTNALNRPKETDDYKGYRVVAAYPTKGSEDMKDISIARLPKFTEALKKQGVEMVDSIDDLLTKVDVVLLESVDGRRHLAEALPVLKAGKLMFIDKPLAASLSDGIAIFNAAKKYNVPVFSASSLRYIPGAKEMVEGKMGKILGADTYGDCFIEPHHGDLMFYGIHGVEMLYAIMGTGCKSVSRVHIDNTDIVVGNWGDNRLGSFRGTRSGTGSMGATIFAEKGIETLTKSAGYSPLWVQILEYFETGKIPISPEETLEEFAFMEAADESRKKDGATIDLAKIMARAEAKAKKISI